MSTLIVYDSVFGNTEILARALGRSLGGSEPALVCRAAEVTAERLASVKTLVVGSPTRAFRPTRSVTDFLKKLPPHALDGVRVAAFDTRVSMADVKSKLLEALAKIFGYAAAPLAVALQKKGGRLVLPAEGFFVAGKEGPLKPGELERAEKWVKGLSSS